MITIFAGFNRPASYFLRQSTPFTSSNLDDSDYLYFHAHLFPWNSLPGHELVLAQLGRRFHFDFLICFIGEALGQQTQQRRDLHNFSWYFTAPKTRNKILLLAKRTSWQGRVLRLIFLDNKKKWIFLRLVNLSPVSACVSLAHFTHTEYFSGVGLLFLRLITAFWAGGGLYWLELIPFVVPFFIFLFLFLGRQR